MILESFPVGYLRCNCTILGDEVTHEAIVVDPGDNIPEILSRLEKHGLALRQIVITHAHIDHIGGAAQLKKATGAPVLLNQKDLGMLNIMEIQAGWLGVPTPEVAPPDASAEDGLAKMAWPSGSPPCRPRSCTLQDIHRAVSASSSRSSVCCSPATHSLPDRSVEPIFPEATDGRSCVPCGTASWFCPMLRECCQDTAPRQQLARKDSQIRFFSPDSVCDTLTTRVYTTFAPFMEQFHCTLSFYDAS
jgi:hypothetical protein